jgi:hypothetical protein
MQYNVSVETLYVGDIGRILQHSRFLGQWYLHGKVYLYTVWETTLSPADAEPGGFLETYVL